MQESVKTRTARLDEKNAGAPLLMKETGTVSARQCDDGQRGWDRSKQMEDCLEIASVCSDNVDEESMGSGQMKITART